MSSHDGGQQQSQRTVALLGRSRTTLEAIRQYYSFVERRPRMLARIDATVTGVDAVVIAEPLVADMSWSDWWEAVDEAHSYSEVVLPALSERATIIVVGQTDAIDSASRRAARSTLTSLIAHTESDAAMLLGKDVTAHAIEVPAGHESQLLASRLGHFISRPQTMAISGVVLRYEDLLESSIAAAITGTAI